MKKSIAFTVITIACLGIAGFALSDAGRWGWGAGHPAEWEQEAEESQHGGWLPSRPDVAPTSDATYQRECGACHFAYQPGLLSAAAWERIMETLGDHFGDDASLADDTAAAIRGYLFANSADRSDQSRSRAFAALPGALPALPRITETAYFRREHHEIPPRLVGGNDAVRSFANCQACHRGAAQGVYNEHQVSIPGAGRWDD